MQWHWYNERLDVHWQDLHFRLGKPSIFLPVLWLKPRTQSMQAPTSVAFTWQWGQVTFEPWHIRGITRQPISHSSLEQNSHREVISFLAAGKSEGVAPSSWLKVGTSFFRPTEITFRLSEDGEGDGWTCSTVGAFPGDFASCSETSWDFSVVEASFFLQKLFSSSSIASQCWWSFPLLCGRQSFLPPGFHGEGELGPHSQSEGEGHRLVSQHLGKLQTLG